MPYHVQVVVVGGGIVGASAAYHLAELGVSGVLLLEQNAIGPVPHWCAPYDSDRQRIRA